MILSVPRHLPRLLTFLCGVKTAHGLINKPPLTMVLTATKVIDGRDHLLGRLASIVAKELLAGQNDCDCSMR